MHISCFLTVDRDLIDNLINQIKENKFLNLIDTCHLSLVRGHFIIGHHQIKPLLDSIKENTSIYHCFHICLSDLILFKNEKQTKCFICLVDSNDLKLNSNTFGFCKAIRDSILQFDFQNDLNSTEQFNFHLSLAWCEAKFEKQLIELINKLKDQIEPVLIKVKEFKVKIGNQEHKFYLKEH